MPNTTIENQIITVSKNILSLDTTAIEIEPPKIAAWQNLDVKDYIAALEDLKSSVGEFSQDGFLSRLPWNILNSLHGQLNNAFTHSQNFLNTKQQQHFQQALQQVESARTNLQTWGINSLFSLQIDIDDKSKLLDDEIQKFLAYNREIEQIKTNVSQLIEPAVAGSLSKSFETRKRDLHQNKGRWFWASIAMAVIAIVVTLVVVSSIIGIFNNEILIALISSKESGSGILWLSVLLRVGVLVPVYTLFMFGFSQYKNERNLEEIYAHKEAVATSLPNYGDLAVDNQVKDQILSEASKVIFTSPEAKGKKDQIENNVNGLEEVNKVLGNIHKLVPKSRE